MGDKFYKCLNSGNYFPCEARQYSDQKYCKRCSFTWDMNDPNPPKCMTGKELFDRERIRLKRMNKNA